MEKRGRTGRKVQGDTLEGRDTRVKAIKSDSDNDSDEHKNEQKRSSVFEKKINRGDIAELATKKRKKVARFFRNNRGVAAPGVTHPSDATVICQIVAFNGGMYLCLTHSFGGKLPKLTKFNLKKLETSLYRTV